MKTIILVVFYSAGVLSGLFFANNFHLNKLELVPSQQLSANINESRIELDTAESITALHIDDERNVSYQKVHMASFLLLKNRHRNPTRVRLLAAGLAADNPLEGLREIHENEGALGDEFENVKTSFLLEWFLKDPRGFFASAEQVKEITGNLDVSHVWLESAISEDFDAVLNNWSHFPAGELRILAASKLGRILANENLTSAVLWAQSLPQPEKTAALLQAIQARANDAPADCARFLTELPPGQDRESMVRAVAQAWAKRDISGALDWLIDSSSLQEYDSAYEAVFSEFAVLNPTDAVEYALREMNPTKDESMIQQSLRTLAEHDIESARNYVRLFTERFPESDFSQTLPDSEAASLAPMHREAKR